jgi:hypothetical protein
MTRIIAYNIVSTAIPFIKALQRTTYLLMFYPSNKIKQKPKSEE